MRQVAFVISLSIGSIFATGCGDDTQPANPDAPAGIDAGADAPAPVTIQVLDISDWHGQLDPITVRNVGKVGGAPVLAAYFKQDRLANPNTLTLTAGDAFGATPPLSAFFNDEPTVLSLNHMGLQGDTFGNHNFDHGLQYLQHLIGLAQYKFVSANLTDLSANLQNVASPFNMVTVGGVKVAVVGLTNTDAASLVAPGSMGTLTVSDPVAAAMSAKTAARQAGADVVIAMIHEGATGMDASGNPTGPLIDFAKGVSGFDLILGDHTDVVVNQIIGGQHVVENHSKGVTYARIEMRVDRAASMVDVMSVDIVTPLESGTAPDGGAGDGGVGLDPDPDLVALLAPYKNMLSAQFDATIGQCNGTYPRNASGAGERTQETALGDLIADSMRTKYGTQLALTNGGGIRDSLPSNYAPQATNLSRPPSGTLPYDLVKGDPYTILPFGNVVITRSVTGTQIWQALEKSVAMEPSAFGGFLQISGFSFTYSLSAPAGSRVTAVTLDGGTAIANDSTPYTLALPDFTNSGGDGHLEFADGQGVSRGVMADILTEYIMGHAPLTPAVGTRITQVP